MNSRRLMMLAALLLAGALAACSSSDSTPATPLSPELASVQGTWVSGCRSVGLDSWVDSVTIAGSTMTLVTTDHTGVTDCSGVGVAAAPQTVTLVIGGTITPTNDAGPANTMDMVATGGTVKSIIKIDTSVTPNTFRIGYDLGTVDPATGRLTDLEARVFTQMTGALLTLQGTWLATCENELTPTVGSWINTFHALGGVLTVETLQFSGYDCPAGTGVVQPFSPGDQGTFTIGATITPTNDPAPAYEFDFTPTGSATVLGIVQIVTSATPNTFRIFDDLGAVTNGRFTDLETRVFTRQ